MKFNCGETWEEEKARKSKWHRWFAWKPVRVGSHDCRWMEYVERKGQHYNGLYHTSSWMWKYRAIK